MEYSKKPLVCQVQNDFYALISAGSTIFIYNTSAGVILAISKQNISTQTDRKQNEEKFLSVDFPKLETAASRLADVLRNHR